MAGTDRVFAVILFLTVTGLAITELHFARGTINATQYLELVTFLYGGGVMGKLVPVLFGLWLEHRKGNTP